MSGGQAPKRTDFTFELSAGSCKARLTASVTVGPARPVDLLPVLQSVNDEYLRKVVEGCEQGGRKVTCRSGCGACCRQIVPVSETEARYLAGVVESMPAEAQSRVRERFRMALERLESAGLGERLRSIHLEKELSQRRHFGREYFELQIPCPFLENETCGIYAHRPMKCREYLVTSPAANCAEFRPDTIEPVQIPARFSEVLFSLSSGIEGDSWRWVPLVLALEWVAGNRPLEPAIDAGLMFANLLNRLTRMSRASATSMQKGHGSPDKYL